VLGRSGQKEALTATVRPRRVPRRRRYGPSQLQFVADHHGQPVPDVRRARPGRHHRICRT
jgi:hypothetical protein